MLCALVVPANDTASDIALALLIFAIGCLFGCLIGNVYQYYRRKRKQRATAELLRELIRNGRLEVQ